MQRLPGVGTAAEIPPLFPASFSFLSRSVNAVRTLLKFYCMNIAVERMVVYQILYTYILLDTAKHCVPVSQLNFMCLNLLDYLDVRRVSDIAPFRR